MPETQIKVEILSFVELFPFYLQFLRKKLNIEFLIVKKHKSHFNIRIKGKDEEIFNFVENFYNYGNIFDVQKVTYSYK